MSRMASTTVYLTLEQLEKLKEISEKTEIPQAAIIRKGVSIAIEQAEAKIAAESEVR